MERIKVKIINHSHHPLPTYETFSAAGMDIPAYLPDGPVTLAPGERRLIPTGLEMQLEHGFECQIRPRSGLALRNGITVLNTPGTVDADSRREIGVILINLGQEPFTVADGDRIAQMAITSYIRVDWEPVEHIDRTERGTGAFGHTGV